jgi:hypothetical protein
LELASCRTLSLETKWSFKTNNLLCQLENDILHHHKQTNLIFLTHKMHVSLIPCNYLNLHCIILIPNIILLMRHKSKILLKINNLPYWYWRTKLSASEKSKKRNETLNSRSNKHSGCPDRQLMSKQHENRYKKAELFIVATALICTSSAMREPNAYYLNSNPTHVYIITYSQAWLNVLHNEFSNNYKITLNSEV